MSHHLLIRSRRGNLVVGILGTAYVLVAATLMAVLLYSVCCAFVL